MLVGVVIVLGVAVAVAGTLWLQGIDWRRNLIVVDALSRDVGQLMEGNSVKLRGVQIGQVEAIAVDSSGEAVRVSLRIDRSVPLPPDPVVLFSMESMFGDWQAEILSRQRFPWVDYWEPEEPGVLGAYALPDMSRLTATADRISESLAVLTERVELAFTEETAVSIREAIINIQEVSEQLTTLIEQQANALDEVAVEVRDAATGVADVAQSAKATFDGVNAFIDDGAVDSLFVDTRQAAANVRALSDELANAADDIRLTLERADSTLARFERITRRIESGDGGLGRLVADTALVTRAESALAELNLLLEDFRENPKRYVRLSIF